MNTEWLIRFEGTADTVPVETAQRVLEGIRDGEWEPSDEVRGPADKGFAVIEEHPLFAESVAEMGEPIRQEASDDALDMNPMIDVCLVLLIFFILTTTYESLRRTIDVPAEPENKEAVAKQIQDDIRDKAFTVAAWMESGKPTIKIEDEVIPFAELDAKVKLHVKATGRTEMMLEVDGRVPWGIEAAIHDAAKGANIHQIYRKKKAPN